MAKKFRRTPFSPPGRAAKAPAAQAAPEVVSLEDALFTASGGRGVGQGQTLALGDVNADGTLDLIAGAPRTTVEETLGAGGVFALAGSATGVDGAMASFMRISHPGTDDRLGASVATLRTHYGITGVTPRHEVAAGAPGANTAFIFLCSGLGDDASTTGDRCLELATE